MPLKIDEASIAEWMQERYAFWKVSSPRYADRDGHYWPRQLKAELPIRLSFLGALQRHVEDPSATFVVDVGIGEGMFPWLLQKLDFRVVGIGWRGEQSQVELEKANPGVRVLSVRYDRDWWPLPDACADIVTLWEVVEHVHPPLQHLFSEILRILKPGGLLLGSTPNAANLRKRLFVLMGKSIYRGFSCDFSDSDPLKDYYASDPFVLHIREFTAEEIRQLLRWAGFEAVRVFSVHQSIYCRLAERGGPLRKALVILYKSAGDFLGVRDTLWLEGRKAALPPQGVAT